MLTARRTLVLLRPLVGVLDSLNPVIPIPLLAICRNIDTSRYDVVIIDQRMSGWRQRLDEALTRDVLLVGITSLTGYQIYFGIRLARHVRRRAPRVPIVWGGVHPTAAPEQTLREPFVDMIVVGEGEEAFPSLVEAVDRGEALSEVPGLGYKRPDGELQFNPRQPMLDISDLDDLPYHLIDMRAYVDALEDSPFYGVEGSRGCVYECTFCYNPTYNQQRWRPRSPKRMVDNIERLHRAYGIRNFFIADDCFFVSIKRALEFASLMKSRCLPVKWGSEANLCILNKLDDASLQLLEDSGLDMISIGVESGSEKVVRFVNKPLDLRNLVVFNRRIRRFSIHPKYTFMTGTPVEEKEDIEQSIALVDTLLRDNCNALIQAFYLATPYPGTVYLEQCREYGFVPPSRLEQWADFDPFSVARYLPWVTGRKRRMFEFMMYGTLFVDEKADYHMSGSTFSTVTALLGRFYRPLARFRFRHFLYAPFPEGALVKLVNVAQKALAFRG